MRDPLIVPMDNIKYDDLLINWEANPNNFILWAKYVCGAKYELLCDLSVLIKTEIDLRRWISLFDGDFDNIEETTILYKSTIWDMGEEAAI